MLKDIVRCSSVSGFIITQTTEADVMMQLWDDSSHNVNIGRYFLVGLAILAVASS
jgi:hypothetical protein